MTTFEDLDDIYIAAIINTSVKHFIVLLSPAPLTKEPMPSRATPLFAVAFFDETMPSSAPLHRSPMVSVCDHARRAQRLGLLVAIRGVE